MAFSNIAPVVSGIIANTPIAAIMKEDATGQRYLQVQHFITRGVPSSIITLAVVVTLGYGAMRVMGM